MDSILSDSLPDFDTLVKMHESDPAAYEAFRQKMLRDAISQAPEQHRPMLNQTLAAIEDARNKAENPLHATILASSLMQQSLTTLRSGMHHLQFATNDLQNAAASVLDPSKKTYIR
jgi:hypothetical protein